MAELVHYVRIESDGQGGSRMVDVHLEQVEAVIAAGVPPVMVSSPIPTGGLIFVNAPADLTDTEPHPAPRRQFVVMVSGVLECETTDGAVRRFGPGSVVLAADTDGAGHITRVPEPPARVLMIPVPD
jgi:hypothetical protein